MKKLPKRIHQSEYISLAVTAYKGSVLVFSKNSDGESTEVVYQTSKDGQKFSKKTYPVSCKQGRSVVDGAAIVSMKVSASAKGLVATFGIVVDSQKKFFLASSTDIKNWKIISEISRDMLPATNGRTMQVQATYYSDKSLWAKRVLSKSEWTSARIVAGPRIDTWDGEPLRVIAVIDYVLIYDSPMFSRTSIEDSVGTLTLSPKHPDTVLGRGTTPVWYGRFDTSRLEPLGAAYVKNRLLIYWNDAAGKIISVSVDTLSKGKTFRGESGILERSRNNPIISPRDDASWEANGTFNPAAFLDDVGHTHLLYRAIGTDGISRVGHAESSDGIHFHKRSIKPVYEENIDRAKHMLEEEEERQHHRYDPAQYTSGGSWSGAEDPRAVRIGNRVYMLYVSFEGWNSIRIALTSIDMHDLKKGKWLWAEPRMISPSNQTNKNWLLFPEKIKNKFAVLHSIVPHVQIAQVPDINKKDLIIQSPRPDGPQPGRRGFWDNMIRGAGPPPLKVRDGWLLLYHAIDKKDPGKYKLGAMILDRTDPTKVLYRSAEPVLSPRMQYENDGKPGVVYASGAVIRHGTLYIYYGGGDRVVCVATAPVDKFLDQVKHGTGMEMEYNKVVLNKS